MTDSPAPISAEVRAAADELARAAMARVRDARGVRVEDYLAVLASLTGEAALLAAGMFDLEATDVPPGAPVFGDRVNVVLTGDTTDPAAVPASSVVGILIAELVPDVFSAAQFGSLEALYRGVAENVGKAEWGRVSTSVPDDNQPTILPIQVAFELRGAVDAAVAAAGLSNSQRHAPCAVALSVGLRQVREAIDMNVGLLLALEIVFGTAKMMPMSRRAFTAAQSRQDA